MASRLDRTDGLPVGQRELVDGPTRLRVLLSAANGGEGGGLTREVAAALGGYVSEAASVEGLRGV